MKFLGQDKKQRKPWASHFSGLTGYTFKLIQKTREKLQEFKITQEKLNKELNVIKKEKKLLEVDSKYKLFEEERTSKKEEQRTFHLSDVIGFPLQSYVIKAIPDPKRRIHFCPNS